MFVNSRHCNTFLEHGLLLTFDCICIQSAESIDAYRKLVPSLIYRHLGSRQAGAYRYLDCTSLWLSLASWYEPRQKRMRGKEIALGKKNVRSSGINAYSDNRAESGIREGRRKVETQGGDSVLTLRKRRKRQ